MDGEISEVGDRVGREPTAEFEILQGTETETLKTVPEGVVYGEYTIQHITLPMVVFEFKKAHKDLPPWYALESFTLHGDETATFNDPGHTNTKITGRLKTVHIAAGSIEFGSSGAQ